MKRKFTLLLAAVLLLLCLGGCVKEELPETTEVSGDGLTVTFLDVGQADCTLLSCGGEYMLIDGGNVEDGSLVVSFLTDSGVESLDYVVCTHAHEDHCGGLPAVMAKFPVETVLSPVTERDVNFFEDFVKYIQQQGLEITVPEAGDSFSLGESSVTVLSPAREYEDINDTSISLRVVYGETSFLFTGDAESEPEHDMVDSGYTLRSTVYHVGHHGSDTSSAYVFLREVMPQYAVISCGVDNSYGHPHEEVLSRLRDVGAEVYRTDLQGTITCVSDGKTLTFTTETYVPVTNPTETDGSGQNSVAADYYIGNKNSMVYHLPSCSSLPAEKNRVTLETLEDAVSGGYTPCSNCVG